MAEELEIMQHKLDVDYRYLDQIVGAADKEVTKSSYISAATVAVLLIGFDPALLHEGGLLYLIPAAPLFLSLYFVAKNFMSEVVSAYPSIDDIHAGEKGKQLSAVVGTLEVIKDAKAIVRKSVLKKRKRNVSGLSTWEN